MSTGNQEYIRDMNRALVLEAIANHPPLSRADLAKMLHLTKATVSTIVQELLDRQLVIELGSAEKTSMGRKPILLTFNNRCGSIIAVDLGVKKITILTGDLKGKSCTVKEYPIDPSLSLEEYSFELLCCSLDQQLVYFIKLICFCQELFSSFFEAVFATRGSHPAPN